MSKLNNEQKEKLKKSFFGKIKQIKKEDIKLAIQKGKEKIEELNNNHIPNILKEFWHDIKDMWNLLVDYYNGNYKNVPWGTIASIVVALLYFASPVDIIPDFIPGIGYIDDIFIISLALKLISKDLTAYKEWKNEN